ncbi:MAG: Do family serine endopeptidase [Acidobacteria bacterium]|nr:Do family serine endopeptidase [Acidobacteriota bacterium]
MSNRKTTLFYPLLIAVVSLAVGMVIASRLGLAPESGAQTTAPPQNKQPISGPIDSTTFRTIAKTVTPMVVNIRTESRQKGQDLSDFFGGGGSGGNGGNGGNDDPFERFFGGGGGQRRQQQAPKEQIAVAAGTGFIIDKAGFILTNNHVVEGATKIEVSLYGEDDDHLYKARVVGRDPLSDSALIELTEKPNHVLPEVKFGDSSQMQPGDWVMAIGNPFGLAHTVSVGVISAVERSFPVADGRSAQVLQTDAAINPGNSGGPLLNVRGEVVGINTAIYSDSRQSGNIGIGFAMPINLVRDLLPQLRSGKITRGRIGVGITPIPANALNELGLTSRAGALVSTVDKKGPAGKAGVEPGDVIIEFNGKAVKNNTELVSMVVVTKPGTTVPVKVMRDKQTKALNITIDELNLESETTREAKNDADDQEQTSKGFGLTLGNVTADVARRLRLGNDVQGAVIMDIEQGSPAARSGIAPGDVVLQVNRKPVSTAAQANGELNKVRSGGTAFLLILRGGQETFVTITRE